MEVLLGHHSHLFESSIDVISYSCPLYTALKLRPHSKEFSENGKTNTFSDQYLPDVVIS
jgi:hypothetical protein